jgi:hypothetical protein
MRLSISREIFFGERHGGAGVFRFRLPKLKAPKGNWRGGAGERQKADEQRVAWASSLLFGSEIPTTNTKIAHWVTDDGQTRMNKGQNQWPIGVTDLSVRLTERLWGGVTDQKSQQILAFRADSVDQVTYI